MRILAFYLTQNGTNPGRLLLVLIPANLPYSETGFSVEDPDLLLIEGRRARQLVGNLATFHAICLAFQVQET